MDLQPVAGNKVTKSETVQTDLKVKKRDGSSEKVDPNKVCKAVGRECSGLADVDPMRVAIKTISGIFDGVSTKELDLLSINTAASLVSEEPQYGKLAARLLSSYIDKEVRNQEIYAFSQSIAIGVKVGLINDRVARYVAQNARKLNDLIDPEKNKNFEYFGLKTVYDRYLLKHPTSRNVIETPQYFFMRVACALTKNITETKALYDILSNLEYLPGSPTLFNSGTVREQLSSCYLVNSPQDSLESIYDKYKDVAFLSKYAGGVGLSYHNIRARGSHIKGTNGKSNGVVPWLKTLDSSVSAVQQGGLRRGACCIYLEPWHADIESFLELRDNTGDESNRTHNLNLANWLPDLFMERVKSDGDWSLFDPNTAPGLADLWGAKFNEQYEYYEKSGKAIKKIKARDLYARMMRTIAQTGNGWMTFKDAANSKGNQTLDTSNIIHSSNLCTEIFEINSDTETAVCNIGSINLSKYIAKGQFDFVKLAKNIKTIIKQLDTVVDINFYPIDSAKRSNERWRPIGLGMMGLQDVFFSLGMAFDSPEAKALSAKISEEIYYHALNCSADLAEQNGSFPAFQDTRTANGILQFDLWNVVPSDVNRWNILKTRIKTTGLRNSLLIAIAPTATIASIAGCYECIEPQMSNLFKRETLSGEFIQINKYLVDELKTLGMWNESTRNRLKMADGSVQELPELPACIKIVFRTVWEIPQKSLIDMAAERGAFIDQGQSLNLFIENPNIGQLSSMYMYAWEKGLKSTYYLRSRPATKIAKATVVTEAQAVACSLENPSSCEACQ